MSYSAVSERYAKALFELAVEKKSQEKVAADLGGIKALVAESESLQQVVTALSVSKSDKAKVFDALLSKMKAQDLTKKFFHVLIKNGRLSAFGSVEAAFADRLRELNGEVLVKVTSAAGLKKKSVTDIEKALAKALDKKVIAEVGQDEKLLGGLVVTYGSKMFDGSLAGQLETIQRLTKKEIANL
jgi:F-type H+-transporting ATPase subunit delta